MENRKLYIETDKTSIQIDQYHGVQFTRDDGSEVFIDWNDMGQSEKEALCRDLETWDVASSTLGKHLESLCS